MSAQDYYNVLMSCTGMQPTSKPFYNKYMHSAADHGEELPQHLLEAISPSLF
jgi:hypothetical protein